MAAYENIRTVNDGPLFGGRQVFTNILATIAQWNDDRMTRNALVKLSERELDDIGLNYGDIDTMIAANRNR